MAPSMGSTPASGAPARNWNEVTGAVVDAAFRVHSRLGPGLLERVYKGCLAYELRKKRLFVETEVRAPVMYDSLRFDYGYRIDVLVERRVVVEVKAVETIHPAHEAQLLTYLRILNAPVGLLINFHEPLVKDGIVRRIHPGGQ